MDQEERCLFSLDVKEMELLVGKAPGGSLLCSGYWFNFQGRSLRRLEEGIDTRGLEFCV